ncbi:DUF2911 domain-containing protein [Kaistella polysaccharea]|uniref:DUF2911 domain-containing protein n=1 Tax=Kaistella polysaccharea TaxID=2878534 RepID=UPI001CF55145|nr:DUF2911 domain-containing protein [Kaistella polysaccharea]
MKKIILLLVLSFSTMGFAQFNVPTASPRQTVEQEFSLSKITVDYGRPGMKGRKVFGELVPYGKVWRAGANSATRITFNQNVNFGGKEVMAGTYGLFVIPMEKEWKIILNKDAQQWGAYAYDEKLNIAEVTVPVQKTAEKQEWFQIALNPVDVHSLDLVLSWDWAKATVSIKEAKPEVVGKIIEKLNEIKQIEKDAAKK